MTLEGELQAIPASVLEGGVVVFRVPAFNPDVDEIAALRHLLDGVDCEKPPLLICLAGDSTIEALPREAMVELHARLGEFLEAADA